MERKLLQRFGLRDGMRILDVGCGPAIITLKLAELCPSSQLVGLEPDPWRAELAQRAVDGMPQVSIHRGTLTDNALTPESFDYAYARFVFQHISDPRRELAGAVTLLRRGGRLLVADADDGLLSIHPCPPQLMELQRLSEALQQRRGGDRRIGRKLATLLEDAGLSHVHFKALALTSSDLGHDVFAHLALAFRVQRVRKHLGEQAAPLIQAAQQFLRETRWHGVTCLMAAHGVRE